MAKNVTGTKEKKKGNKFTRWVASIFAELKKVTWPKFAEVVKQTLIVLGVTACFLILLIGVDFGLGALHRWFLERLLG